VGWSKQLPLDVAACVSRRLQTGADENVIADGFSLDAGLSPVRSAAMADRGYDFAPLLATELAQINACFDENELAFLALTSKVELPIRDRLAYRLFTQLPELRVAREWNRIDLAVLSADSAPAPLMLLEAKALYTFDLVGGESWIERYPAKVDRDVEKLRRLKNVPMETQFFALVLATHPTGAIDPALGQIAKYSPGVRKAIEAHGDAAAVAAAARSFLQSRLESLGPIHTGEIPAGEAYGIGVEVHFSLLGPIARQPLTSLT
jgi:hypothetical protein